MGSSRDPSLASQGCSWAGWLAGWACTQTQAGLSLSLATSRSLALTATDTPRLTTLPPCRRANFTPPPPPTDILPPKPHATHHCVTAAPSPLRIFTLLPPPPDTRALRLRPPSPSLSPTTRQRASRRHRLCALGLPTHKALCPANSETRPIPSRQHCVFLCKQATASPEALIRSAPAVRSHLNTIKFANPNHPTSPS